MSSLAGSSDWEGVYFGRFNDLRRVLSVLGDRRWMRHSI